MMIYELSFCAEASLQSVSDWRQIPDEVSTFVYTPGLFVLFGRNRYGAGGFWFDAKRDRDCPYQVEFRFRLKAQLKSCRKFWRETQTLQ